jgi:transposase
MTQKKYIVTLHPEEKEMLLALVRKGTAQARRLTRARILLLAHEQKTDQAIGAALQVGVATVERIRQKFVTGNLDGALTDAPRPKRVGKLDGKAQALVIATACSTPPAGRAKWTMQLLAERLVALQVVDTVSDETVRQVLKKTC